ncbi:hypothetical protein DL98DRAFT_575844 [Cadophora sp. DSE1049]|nr:hypothetical protein DL98DRAFT_575844 [Cadophora sp. DSE1049]
MSSSQSQADGEFQSEMTGHPSVPTRKVKLKRPGSHIVDIQRKKAAKALPVVEQPTQSASQYSVLGDDIVDASERMMSESGMSDVQDGDGEKSIREEESFRQDEGAQRRRPSRVTSTQQTTQNSEEEVAIEESEPEVRSSGRPYSMRTRLYHPKYSHASPQALRLRSPPFLSSFEEPQSLQTRGWKACEIIPELESDMSDDGSALGESDSDEDMEKPTAASHVEVEDSPVLSAMLSIHIEESLGRFLISMLLRREADVKSGERGFEGLLGFPNVSGAPDASEVHSSGLVQNQNAGMSGSDFSNVAGEYLNIPEFSIVDDIDTAMAKFDDLRKLEGLRYDEQLRLLAEHAGRLFFRVRAHEVS